MGLSVKLASNIGYQDEAPELLVRYEQLPFGAQFETVQPHLPASFRSVLDIGSGSGQAAAWFAAAGAAVVAVEPTDALREGARLLHREPAIQWLDDGLPALAQVRAMQATFDLVWINAVWMHLDHAERLEAMATVAGLTAPGGHLMISLRHGPVPQGRRMFAVTAEETIALAHGSGMTTVCNRAEASIGKLNIVAGVTWTRLLFKQT